MWLNLVWVMFKMIDHQHTHITSNFEFTNPRHDNNNNSSNFSLEQWFSTRVPRHFGVPRNSENATVIYLKILKLCRDNKKVENHCSRIMKNIVCQVMGYNSDWNAIKSQSVINRILILVDGNNLIIFQSFI